MQSNKWEKNWSSSTDTCSLCCTCLSGSILSQWKYIWPLTFFRWFRNRGRLPCMHMLLYILRCTWLLSVQLEQTCLQPKKKAHNHLSIYPRSPALSLYTLFWKKTLFLYFYRNKQLIYWAYITSIVVIACLNISVDFASVAIDKFTCICVSVTRFYSTNNYNLVNDQQFK